MSKSRNRRNRRLQSAKRARRTSQKRQLRTEQLENRQLLAGNLFHNDVMPEDVTEDGFVSPADAFVLIDNLNRRSQGESEDNRGPGRRTDVNNDGHETALDALLVMNRLNRAANGGDLANGDPDGDRTGRPGNERPKNDRPDDGEMRQQTDAVIEWNDLFGELLVANETDQNPGYASRAMAILNLAIYDAVTLASGNSEDTFYEYGPEVNLDANVRPEIAASQAAYSVLSSLYSDQQEMIDSFRSEVFGRFQRSPVTADSIELGDKVGSQILAARADDGSDEVGDYTYYDDAGYFQPDPLNPDVPVWGPAWGEVDPFSISAAADYVPDSPPDITSAEYAESYSEVKELGSVDSATRSVDELEAGIFWAYDRTGLGTPMALFGDVLETIARQEGNNFHENAALFAQASVAMADAGIVAWQSKFSEQFWRPVTAIHQGDADGNSLTEGDSEWTAIGAPDGGDDIVGFTPQFPTYVSGHATFGGALFGAIREFYGTDDIAFDLTSRELEIIADNPELEAAYGLDLEDATRSFSSLSEAMAENGRSRVYLGIHFDFDDLVGQEVGQAVASSVAPEFVVSRPDNGENPNGPGPSRPDGPRPGNDGPRPGGPRGDQLAGFDPSGLAPRSGMDDSDGRLRDDQIAVDQIMQDDVDDRMHGRLLPNDTDLDMLASDQARREERGPRDDGPRPDSEEGDDLGSNQLA